MVVIGQSIWGLWWTMLPKEEYLGDIIAATCIFLLFIAFLVTHDQYSQGYGNFCGELLYHFTPKLKTQNNYSLDGFVA